MIVTVEKMEAQGGGVTCPVHTAGRHLVIKPATETRSLGFLASFWSLIGREGAPRSLGPRLPPSLPPYTFSKLSPKERTQGPSDLKVFSLDTIIKLGSKAGVPCLFSLVSPPPGLNLPGLAEPYAQQEVW